MEIFYKNRGGFKTKFDKRIVSIIIKAIGVLLIPYYWMVDSHSTSGSRMDTSYLISGPIGYWTTPGSSYEWPTIPTVFWQQNQIIYSILFMIPSILFAFYFGERETNQKSVVAGLAAALIPYLTLFAITPFIPVVSPYLFYLTLPNILTLSMFVFVFWPLLKNSLTLPDVTDGPQKKSGKIAEARKILGEWFPRNVASLVWMCMVIFPTFLTLYVLLGSETETNIVAQIYGGLYYLFYSYREFPGGLYYPARFITFEFETAAWATSFVLGQWIINLYLGFITLQYIQRKTTKRRLNITVLVVILISVIPSLLLSYFTFLFPVAGTFLIALPLYPIAMLLLSKFVQYPKASGKDMIKVPLRIRISSFFQRDTKDIETTVIEDTPDKENDEVD